MCLNSFYSNPSTKLKKEQYSTWEFTEIVSMESTKYLESRGTPYHPHKIRKRNMPYRWTSPEMFKSSSVTETIMVYFNTIIIRKKIGTKDDTNVNEQSRNCHVASNLYKNASLQRIAPVTSIKSSPS